MSREGGLVCVADKGDGKLSEVKMATGSEVYTRGLGCTVDVRRGWFLCCLAP